MTPDEIQALADALADALARKLRAQAKAFADASKSTAETVAVLAGKMDLREQDSAARKTEMIRAVDSLRGELANLTTAVDTTLLVLQGHPRAEEPKPKPSRRIGRAEEELELQKLGLKARALAGLAAFPSRVAAGARELAAYVVANPLKSIAMAGGAVGVLRVISPWIPGSAMVADILQARVDAVTPAEVP